MPSALSRTGGRRGLSRLLGSVKGRERKLKAAKQRGRGDEGDGVISLGGEDDRHGADEVEQAAARG